MPYFDVMTTKHDIDRFRHISVKLPEFAGIAADCVQSLGLEKVGGRGAKGELASDRVIRDYVRRRVLSPTLKAEGERGLYGFRHLLEFLAARVLLNDGWPLEKIAERNQYASEDELLALIPGQPDDNDALAMVRALRAESGSITATMSVQEPSSLAELYESFPDSSPIVRPDRPSVAPDPMVSRRRAELPMLMREITGSIEPPVERTLVSLSLGDRVTLTVDAAYARSISATDAESIGRIVAAALLNLSAKPNKKDRR